MKLFWTLDSFPELANLARSEQLRIWRIAHGHMLRGFRIWILFSIALGIEVAPMWLGVVVMSHLRGTSWHELFSLVVGSALGLFTGVPLFLVFFAYSVQETIRPYLKQARSKSGHHTNLPDGPTGRPREQ